MCVLGTATARCHPGSLGWVPKLMHEMESQAEKSWEVSLLCQAGVEKPGHGQPQKGSMSPSHLPLAPRMHKCYGKAGTWQEISQVLPLFSLLFCLGKTSCSAAASCHGAVCLASPALYLWQC